MVKFPEATERLYKNIFICKKCKTKIRTTPQRVIQKRVKCRRCNSKALRAPRKGKAATGK